MNSGGATRSTTAVALNVTATLDGHVATVVLSGDVDSASACEIADICDAQIASGATRLRLDLSRTSFVDSSGLVVLLDVRAAANNGSVALTLVRPSRAVRRVLELTELLSVFDLER